MAEETPKTKRVQLDLSLKAYADLNELKTLLDCSSYTEVIKTGIRVLKCLVNIRKDGGKLLIQKSDGTTIQLDLLLGD